MTLSYKLCYIVKIKTQKCFSFKEMHLNIFCKLSAIVYSGSNALVKIHNLPISDKKLLHHPWLPDTASGIYKLEWFQINNLQWILLDHIFLSFH